MGYELPRLIAELESFLGWDNTQDAFLAGAGSLGSALLGYTRFNRCGMSIVAAFDSDPAKIGTRIRGKEVLPIERLAELAERMHVHIGVITVPADSAQKVADLMISGGIRAIWNFAPIRLAVPTNVILHNEDLYCSLASLSQKLAVQLRARAEQSAAEAADAMQLVSTVSGDISQ